ncbi:MAG: hypothetical protein HOB38_17780, partial [Deltaproteobacteria bacterium]|nr:hypothetical protein [Deltaproteobacteria bacterium]
MKKFLKVLAGIIILILVAMIASYLVSVGKLEKLTPEVRKSLPGDFIKIKDGVI